MRALVPGLALASLALAACDGGDGGADAAAADAAPACPGSWREGPPLVDPREQSAALLLPDGRVLVAGGHELEPGWIALASAELYDPAAGAFAVTGAMNHTRSSTLVGTALLAGGQVLTAEQLGADFASHIPAELYDPTTGMWSVVQSSMSELANGPLVALPDGDALAVGGIDWTTDTPIAFVQRFRAGDGTWVAVAPLLAPRTGHAAVAIGGEVLVLGGSAEYPSADALASTERYDPASDAWRPAAPMTEARWGARAVLLADGRVLVAGGTAGNSFQTPSAASAEIYDPIADSWSATGSMQQPRGMFSLTRLADGRVLAAGGHEASAGDLASAEIYDPATGEWSPAGAMSGRRRLHSAVLLPDGEVLIVGGYRGRQLDTTELYTPCID